MAIGASPVWVAPNDGSVPAAAQVWIAGYGGSVVGASPVWIAGYGGPPPVGIGATPVCVTGFGGSGSGGSPVVTSVWSASDASVNGMTLTNGGLTVTSPAGVGANLSIRGTIGHTSGKLYVEFSTSEAVSGNVEFGFASAGFIPAGRLGDSNYSGGNTANGNLIVSTGFAGSWAMSFTSAVNDVFSLAIDFTAGLIWIGQNGVWHGSDPTTGINHAISFTPAIVGALFPGLSVAPYAGTVGVWTLQATAASLKYAPPSGFTAWG